MIGFRIFLSKIVTPAVTYTCWDLQSCSWFICRQRNVQKPAKAVGLTGTKPVASKANEIIVSQQLLSDLR